jgi:hypothetical protein
MGQPRETHTATLLPSGKVLVAGGVNYFGGVFPTSAELYDLATGKWSPTLPLISKRRAGPGKYPRAFLSRSLELNFH